MARGQTPPHQVRVITSVVLTQKTNVGIQARAKNLMKYGLDKDRALKSAMNGRGSWWNSGASHMNQCFPKRFFDRLGLVSLLDQLRRLQCAS